MEAKEKHHKTETFCFNCSAK